MLSVSSASALNYSDWYLSVVTAADNMVAAQNSDGSFDWVNDNNPATSGAPNTQGATGRGLVAAYEVTGDINYLNAANAVALYLSNNSTGYYNKDIEFLFELAAAGRTVFTSDAAYGSGGAIAYINQKIIEEGGTGAEAVRLRYLNSTWTAASGTMNGTKLWMIGEWGHVGQLLGNTEIYTGYTGFDMASEMGTLLSADFPTYNYGTDPYGTLGLVGILEATAFGGIGTYGQNEEDAFDALLAQTTTGWQDTGYATYVKSLYGINDPVQLSGWINAGYFDTGAGAYLEGMGEALLGVANAPVPEPATMLLFGLGLLGLAGVSRKKS